MSRNNGLSSAIYVEEDGVTTSEHAVSSQRAGVGRHVRPAIARTGEGGLGVSPTCGLGAYDRSARAIN